MDSALARKLVSAMKPLVIATESAAPRGQPGPPGPGPQPHATLRWNSHSEHLTVL